jgi:phosphoenolpyruvate carboxylase
LYVKFSLEKKIAILIVYVDDIILIGDYEELVRLKKLLAKEFETKDLSYLRYFLGIEVAR